MRVEAIEAEALRRSEELKTSLLRAVSHDLRTPLTAIIAAGAALDSPSVTDSERHELSDAVVDEGQRLSRLVENLLDVSRLESGKAEPHREPIDLVDLLDAARESIGHHGDAVRLALDDDLPTLRADPAQLERAFANLLENAVVHGEGQPVLVRSRLVGPRLVVRVVDRGPGIPENLRERIFEPFYRGAGAASGGGSGLGLAIARGFIEANGGEIEVESLPGQGTSFVVTFAVPVPSELSGSYDPESSEGRGVGR
jgi:two-component system sensor histidine kinase KdpD